jgi:hypothetical protein
MRIFDHNSLTIAVILLVLTGSARATPVSDIHRDGARLSQAQAISIAKKAAERAGYRLTDYEEPRANYEFTKKNKKWSAFFVGRDPKPGNHFLIWIDDQTEKTEVIPGQ